MNIRVSNLGRNTTAESIRAVFATYGEVTSLSIMTEAFSGRSTGTIFIEMPDNDEAIAAIAKTNKSVIDGCIVVVKETRVMTEMNNDPRKNKGV